MAQCLKLPQSFRLQSHLQYVLVPTRSNDSRSAVAAENTYNSSHESLQAYINTYIKVLSTSITRDTIEAMRILIMEANVGKIKEQEDGFLCDR